MQLIKEMTTGNPALPRWATPNSGAEHTIIQTHNVLKHGNDVTPFISI
ncbi:MAG: hypothetical protein HYZ42_15035 [Bacteroidetes bacterium]|nr:hypothetical protein [Bacteroidota bacterium]